MGGKHQPVLFMFKYTRYLGVGTGTVCAGSSSLPIDLASIFASTFHRTYAQETRHIIVRKPNNCVSRGDIIERGSILLQSSLLSEFDDSMVAID